MSSDWYEYTLIDKFKGIADLRDVYSDHQKSLVGSKITFTDDIWPDGMVSDDDWSDEMVRGLIAAGWLPEGPEYYVEMVFHIMVVSDYEQRFPESEEPQNDECDDDPHESEEPQNEESEEPQNEESEEDKWDDDPDFGTGVALLLEMTDSNV